MMRDELSARGRAPRITNWWDCLDWLPKWLSISQPSPVPCPVGCGREGDKVKQRIWEAVRGRLAVWNVLPDVKEKASKTAEAEITWGNKTAGTGCDYPVRPGTLSRDSR